MFSYHNLVHPNVYSTAQFIESQLIKISLDLFRGTCEEDICGVTTSGGTESIIFAIQAYKNKALKEKGITQPEL